MIERFAPGFRDQVVEYEVLGPPDIEERIGLTGGCIFQGECFPDQMWENRLASRTPGRRALPLRRRHPPGRQRHRPERPQRREGADRRRAQESTERP